MSKDKKRHCCHIGCDKDATHTIYYSEQLEDYSDFCEEHIGEYLPDDKRVEVTPIDNN